MCFCFLPGCINRFSLFRTFGNMLFFNLSSDIIQRSPVKICQYFLSVDLICLTYSNLYLLFCNLIHTDLQSLTLKSAQFPFFFTKHQGSRHQAPLPVLPLPCPFAVVIIMIAWSLLCNYIYVFPFNNYIYDYMSTL